ncbi:MAG: hypothetical protein ACI8Q9_002474 [Planctomycetota bacterium]|jgi:hypothetical protein
MGRARGCGTFTEIAGEASRPGAKWRPLSAGLLGGKLEQIDKLAEDDEGPIVKLNWH